jgi:hypothetical protein
MNWSMVIGVGGELALGVLVDWISSRQTLSVAFNTRKPLCLQSA